MERSTTESVLAHRAEPGRAVPWGTLAIAVLAAYTLVYIGWIVTGWGPQDRMLVGDIAPLPVEVAAMLAAFCVAALSTLPRRVRGAWLLLAIAFGLYFAGDLLWGTFENILQESPFPSVADVAYIAYYPFALAGLFLVSRAFRDRAERRDFLLDAGIVVVAAVTVFWDLVLGPTVRGGESDPVSLAILLAYPLGDLVLILGIMSVALRRSNDRTRRALLLLLAGFAVSVLTDLAYLYASASGSYESGSLIDVGYALSWMAWAAASIVQLVDGARGEPRGGMPATAVQAPISRRRLALLASAALVSPAVLVGEELRGDAVDAAVVIVAWVVVVALLVARMTGLVDDVRNRESRLRLLADHARDVLFRYRLDGPAAFDFVSPAITQMTGYSPDDLYLDAQLGRDLIHPDDRPAFDDAARSTDPRAEPFRIRLVGRDGRLVWAELSTTLTRDADGSRVLEGVARDIGPQHAAEEALRESKERLRSVVTGAPIMLLATDAAGTIVLLDGKAVPAAGLQKGRDVGRRAAEVFAGEPGIVDDLRRAMAGETFTATRALAGTLFEGRYAPLHDAHGRVAGAIAVATDVSERARAERERVLLSSVVRQSMDAVLVTDPGGVIVYVNAAFTTLTGYTPEEIIGRHTVVLADAFGSASEPALVEALRRGREWSGGIEIAHVDGTRHHVEFLAMPVRDGGERVEYHVAMGRDVTNERELRIRLEQAQKMEAVGQLAGGLAHDFNNLLTAVSGYAQLVHTSLDAADPSRDDVAEIMKASDRAAALTRQLLAFSRKQVLQPRVLDLAALIRDVQRLLARLLGEDVTLVTAIDPEVGNVRADPGHLEQVLVNLAVNARDAMPAGGTLTIGAGNVELDEAFVASHPGSFSGHAVRLSVTDTGTGMDAATRTRVFEPFFTTKEQGRGTGLGLSTVYGIVKQSGGYVMVESRPGRGSTFTVFLPMAHEPVDSPGPSAAVFHHQSAGSGTVLVVEDDPAVRALMVTTLSRRGFRVVEAADPDSALRLVSPENPADLLISDVVMPGMQGPALSAMLTRMLPDLRTLFVSGYPREALGPGNVVDPSVSFLGKPFTPDELSNRVRQLLS